MSHIVDATTDGIYRLELPSSGDQIWSEPSLNKEAFFAALYCLSGRTQEHTSNRLGEQKPPEDHFLDRLALIFARLKKKNTPGDVTATALVKRDGCWTVYIAKNKWSRLGVNEEISEVDVNHAKEVQDWFNTQDDKHYFKKVLAFWEDRIKFYAIKSKSLWPQFSPFKDDIMTFFQENSKDFEEERFDSDWARMEKLVDYLRTTWTEKSQAHTVEDLFYTKFYNFWSRDPDSPRQHYTRPKPDEGLRSTAEKAAEHFCKCLRYIEMLGMPVSFMRSMGRLNDLREDHNIQILLVKASIQDEDNPKSNGIQRQLEAWGNEPNSPINVKAALTKVKGAYPWERATNYFHCELQLYLLSFYLDKDASMHKFIGGSKLSCQLCWEILEDAEYRTRASHHQVSPNCAFPFPRYKDSTSEKLRSVLGQFERAQAAIVDKARGRGNDGLQYPVLDTDPAQTDKDLRCLTAWRNLKVKGHKKEALPYIRSGSMPVFKGTYGRVYAAYSTQSIDAPLGMAKQVYAIKEIKVQNSLHLERVQEEIKILRSLKHDNILILKEEFFDQQKPHIVHLVTRPWAPATLERVLKYSQRKNDPWLWWYTPRRVDPWPEIVRECLEGLDFLHHESATRGSIKHKDLKPSNILLQEVPDVSGVFERNGERFRIRPIIADFGLSKQFVLGGTTDNLGTLAFKSPQQRRNDPETLLETDIWSLGCCFAFILVQLRSGQTKVDTLWKAIEQPKERSPFDQKGKLFEILQEPCTITSPKDLVIFQQELHSLVTEMVEPEPKNRPYASDALSKIKDVEAHLRVVNLGLPNIYHASRIYGSSVIVSSEQLQDLPTWANLLKACNEFLGRHLPVLERMACNWGLRRGTRLRFFTFISENTGPKSRAIEVSHIPFSWDRALVPSELPRWTFSEFQYTSLARLWQVRQEQNSHPSLSLGVYIEMTLEVDPMILVMVLLCFLVPLASWTVFLTYPSLTPQFKWIQLGFAVLATRFFARTSLQNVKKLPKASRRSKNLQKGSI